MEPRHGRCMVFAGFMKCHAQADDFRNAALTHLAVFDALDESEDFGPLKPLAATGQARRPWESYLCKVLPDFARI